MKTRGNIECFSCGSCNATIIMELRYNGLRGKCFDCGGNWPET